MRRFARTAAISAFCIGGLLAPSWAFAFSAHAVRAEHHTAYSPVQSRVVQRPVELVRAPGHWGSVHSQADLVKPAPRPAAPVHRPFAVRGKR